ncbi:peptidylprolyl isomerase [Cytobacillus purgationiresistens]|uniref:Peptidyl-prolyl cis-trans isomerase n=1 Tax=Cytobacillus purgationiresistens TaxID=863449 RepID=A0ABU0AJG8_9BACI|nr:peptidylprolyl isomerase [Cytobacillus purgationiresistens]MDQ0270892.1 peptidyl-prolyl cis-trans isomerase B (cyclophilin B) [Cytobacillus purgationiresistens]
MKLRLLASIFALLLILAGCGTSSNDGAQGAPAKEDSDEPKTEEVKEYPQLSEEVKEDETLVEMQTSMGTIKIKLFPEIAPKAVENFITHSKDGYYDGVIFHRVIEEFMLQSGDPEGTGVGGESIYGDYFEDEFSNQLFNIRGALSMANRGANTNGSQFFIVQNTVLGEGLDQDLKKNKYPEQVIEKYKEGGTPWLDGKHTVFGQVIEGMDVVDQIAATEKDEKDKPVKDVVIEKIIVQE